MSAADEYAVARKNAISRLATALRPLPTPEQRYNQAEWVFDGIAAALEAKPTPAASS